MRYLILFYAMFFAAGTPAFAAKNADKPSKTAAAVQAMKDYCLPALERNMDPADFAIGKQLIEFPPEQARKFAPDGGRVFAIPAMTGNAVLTTNKNYKSICNIAIREVRAPAFWAAVDAVFNTRSGFSLRRERRIEEQQTTKKEFSADIGGPIVLLMTLSDKPRPSGMQGLLTAARVVPEK